MNDIKNQLLFWLKELLFFLVLIAGGFVLFLIPPLAQDVSYHHFADTRAFYLTPYFLNVISNALIFLASLLGLLLLIRKKISLPTLGEKILIPLFFIALFLISIGSAFYHLRPNHYTLVFDRIPIAIAFSSFFSLLITQRISSTLGLILAPFLIVSSILTIFYWYNSELIGFGDLRPYILVQTLPIISIPLFCILFPSRHFRDRYLLLAFVFYLLAFYCELHDHELFFLTQNRISGHTLKHIAGGLSALFILCYLSRRK